MLYFYTGVYALLLSFLLSGPDVLLLTFILLCFLLASSELCGIIEKEFNEMSKWPSVGI